MLLLKTAPQDLPHSPGLVVRVIFLYFLSGIFVQSSVVDTSLAMNMMVVNIIMLLTFAYALLSLRRLNVRFFQTISAVFGTGVIFNLLAWPFVGMIGVEGLSDFVTSLIALLMLSMLSWELLVTAHIYRNALNLNMVYSIMLSFALFFISVVISQTIFPEIS
jgi:hypothetical protein